KGRGDAREPRADNQDVDRANGLGPLRDCGARIERGRMQSFIHRSGSLHNFHEASPRMAV
ncbi:MAG: hypothetical protein EBW19_05270, partial [Betaproteobacteria bacterium]|nr:hypothetical protein [Betaproteobacteria bacterium]